jgi:glyoxylase-like metal-dependent hydrolase (beta-lactamase superfamily II)
VWLGQHILDFHAHADHFGMLQNVGHPFIGEPYRLPKAILNDFQAMPS